MINSPYDNLPSGSSDETIKRPEYIDVEITNQMPPEPAPAAEEKPSEIIPPAPKPKPAHTAKPVVKSKPVHGQQHTRLNISNLCESRQYVMPFEEALLVPDTMPDIRHILFAEGKAEPVQQAKSTYSRNDIISGEITIYTVYRPESDSSPVDVIKSSVPFRTDKCWSVADGESFKVAVRIRSVRAEMINERKITVKGEILFNVTAIMQKELNLFRQADDTSLVCEKQHTQVTSLAFELKDEIEISQDINIAADQPSPVKILKQSIRIAETHRQITSGKLIINASIYSQILYSGLKDDEHKLASLSNKTDFTQFIPIKDTADINLIHTEFDAGNLQISIENQDQLLLSGTVTTHIYGCENIDIETVCDAYHKSREIFYDTATPEICAAIDTVSGEISAREVISIDSTETASDNHPDSPCPHTLLCGCAEIEELEVRSEHSKIIIEGSAAITILALDESDNAFIIEKAIPLRGSLESQLTVENLIPDVTACIRSFWFDKINLRQIEANISLGIEVWLMRKSQPQCIENIYINEDAPAVKPASLAVYITGGSDTLWDIAKKYRSDTDTIAALNHLDPMQSLSEGMKLLISQI